jgi:integration host factor subunit alpha
MALTKAGFSEKLFDELGLNKTEANEMVWLFFEGIKNALEQGVAVKISGFGRFGLRDKSDRPGKNPKTGEASPIKARRVVIFSANQKLKAQIPNQNS